MSVIVYKKILAGVIMTYSTDLLEALSTGQAKYYTDSWGWCSTDLTPDIARVLKHPNQYYIATLESCVHLALKRKYTTDMFQIIKNAGHDLNLKQNAGQNGLHYFVLFRDESKLNMELLSWLLTHMNPQEITHKDHAGNTPLDLAIRHSEMQVVYQMLHCLTVNNLPFPQSILLEPRIINSNKTVDLILKHDPTRLNVENSYKETPIHVAIKQGAATSLRLLLDKTKELATAKQVPLVECLKPEFDQHIKLLNKALKPRDIDKADHGKTIRRLFKTMPPVTDENQPVRLAKELYIRAIKKYFLENKSTGSFGLGCAVSFRRMHNASELLALLKDSYQSVDYLQDAMTNYCNKSIKTGLLGRSLLADGIKAVKLNAIELHQDMPTLTKK